jgi:hypothetical protein
LPTCYVERRDQESHRKRLESTPNPTSLMSFDRGKVFADRTLESHQGASSSDDYALALIFPTAKPAFSIAS